MDQALNNFSQRIEIEVNKYLDIFTIFNKLKEQGTI